MNGRGGFLSPYMGGQNYELPTGLIKPAYPPSATVNGAVWVTHTRIDENPGIRGHDLCFDKTCQGNRLAKRAEVER